MSPGASWYEIWADEGLNPPYLLIVRSTRGGHVEVLDTRDDHRVVHVADNYEDACLWLSEDEYTQVVGRMSGGNP